MRSAQGKGGPGGGKTYGVSGKLDNAAHSRGEADECVKIRSEKSLTLEELEL